MERPTAFVIMPFGPEFDEIYNMFIADSLSEAGFEPVRADDIRTSRNILRDIVESIQSARLVVADVTGGNENVFYELGLAHAFGKPVIMLTQSIEEAPFDLRSYRFVVYSTHFAKIKEARSTLSDLASSALTGEMKFGNPVLDFGAMSSIQSDSTSPPVVTEAGLLDHLSDFEESMEQMAPVLVRITEGTSEIGEYTKEATGRLERSHLSARERRAVVQEYAARLRGYCELLEDGNRDYSDLLLKFESGLDFIVGGGISVVSESDKVGLEGFLKQLHTFTEASTSSRDSTVRFYEMVLAMPKVERTFIAARDRAARALKTLVGNLEKTISVLNRSESLGSDLLEKIVQAAEVSER